MFLYWSLQMSWRLKLGLFALTGGGLVVGAAAVLKVSPGQHLTLFLACTAKSILHMPTHDVMPSSRPLVISIHFGDFNRLR